MAHPHPFFHSVHKHYSDTKQNGWKKGVANVLHGAMVSSLSLKFDSQIIDGSFVVDKESSEPLEQDEDEEYFERGTDATVTKLFVPDNRMDEAICMSVKSKLGIRERLIYIFISGPIYGEG